ncbi:MAG: energy transducer TonB [Flavobacteriales bacterium]|nr:energy transducer TonB [Flavobacteriales bacterium]
MQEKKSPEANIENKRFFYGMLGFMAVGGILLGSVAWTNYDVERKRLSSADLELIEDEEIPVNISTPPPPPPPPQQTQVIEIVEDDEEIEEELDLDLEIEEDTEIEEIEEYFEEVEEEEVFMIVEKMPAFPGCEDKRGDELKQCTEIEVITFVQSNVKYPAIAKDAGIQGTVFVYYEINKKGEVDNVEVLRGVHPSLDGAAKSAVESLPKHKPGEQRGKSVRVRYTIPVRFTIR